MNNCPYCDYEFEVKPRRNCDYEFEVKPRRTKKCPSCENYIFVRQGDLYTEKGKDIFDWIGKLTNRFYAVPRYDSEEKIEELFEKEDNEVSERFGFDAPAHDVIWGVLNKMGMYMPDPYYRSQVYEFQVDLLKTEGRDYTHILDLARKSLAEWHKDLLIKEKKDGITHVTIRTSNDYYVCDVCNELSKREIPIDEAIEKLPVPYDCKNEHDIDLCRCQYRRVSKHQASSGIVRMTIDFPDEIYEQDPTPEDNRPWYKKIFSS